MSSLTVLVCSLLYLCTLFLIAYWVEKRSRAGKSLVNSPYVYALSLAVYCSAWTFYGSVGRAASAGIEVMAIYIGPTLSAPLWWIVLRKIIRICKVQRITSIADFVSARYGKSRTLGVLATLICVGGLIPYISIQLKAVGDGFRLLSGQTISGGIGDQTLYITLMLVLFTILFGARKLEATERREGMIAAIVFESVVKLVAFLAVGIFVTFWLFDGPADIFGRVAAVPELQQRFVLRPGHTATDWFWYSLLSMLAIVLLPRQFQVAVVENVDEKHLDKAMWLLPLYLFLITLFVLPLAMGGQLLMSGLPAEADGYVVSVPLKFGQPGLALLAYLGGLSAATGMIIVETTALSLMLTNNVILPAFVGKANWQNRSGNSLSGVVINIRRVTILGLFLLSYLYYRTVGYQYPLVSVGLISFAAVAQFAPAVIGGIFWKRGTYTGALLGLIAGTAVWFYTLIVPTLVTAGLLPETLLTTGPWEMGWLKPQALFGLTTLDPLSQSVFWSLFFNIAAYFWGSLNYAQSTRDYNQAVLFVDIFRYARNYDSAIVWKGRALSKDLQSLLASFFGDEQAKRALQRYKQRNQLSENARYADPRVLTFVEKLLSGVVGTASARILVASIGQEEPIKVDEVIEILKTTQELKTVNKDLKRKSSDLEHLTQQLSEANERLRLADQQKDEFLSTVTHEVRTPITSIRAVSEILYDNPDLDDATRRQFLGTVIKETERLTRLINQVLDLERLESGRYKPELEPIRIGEVLDDAVESVSRLADEKAVQLTVTSLCRDALVQGDRDRLMQVLINLMANAIKFCDASVGKIHVETLCRDENVLVKVTDNGIGIDPIYHELIFDKFFQTQEHPAAASGTLVRTAAKPKGSGLGLAISRKIIELHRGTIHVDSQPGAGATFTIQLPLLTQS
ncbi:ATP-binding protein [Nibrella saemangeumensis]|uniref:histidine kinase n=1 Tax=Nibrella saemangeumensis TaxID=1084526 RepID=A0ABP8MV92_9BACT